MPLLLAQDDVPSETNPPSDPTVENIIRRFSRYGKGCNSEQAAVIRQVIYLPPLNSAVPLSSRLTITQGPPGTGKSEVIMICTYVCLEKGFVVMVTGHSNKSVDVNALRLAKKLQEDGKSTKGIYRLLPDAAETMFSQPNVVSREHDPYPGDDVGGVTLRSIPDNQPDPLSETERACLARYLDQQLAGTELDVFSLAAHIKDRLHVVASHNHYWSFDNAHDIDEHNHLKYLNILYSRIKN